MGRDNMKNGDNMSVHTILQQIQEGLVDPINFSRVNRQLCVEALRLEGYQTSAISHLLRVSDRTVRRDIKEIKKKNILEPNVDFARELIGEVYMFAKQHHMHLMRLARTNSSTVSERAIAEASAWKVLKEMLEKFQELGYVPKVPTKIVGDFYQNVSSEEKWQITKEEHKIIDEIALLPARDRDKIAKRLEKRLLDLPKKNDETEQ